MKITKEEKAWGNLRKANLIAIVDFIEAIPDGSLKYNKVVTDHYFTSSKIQIAILFHNDGFADFLIIDISRLVDLFRLEISTSQARRIVKWLKGKAAPNDRK